MKRILIVVVLLVAITALAVPVVAASGWSNKATVNSNGHGYWDTAASADTVVENPYAIRFGLKTGASKRVSVYWSVYCENGSKSGDRNYTTPGNGAVLWVTPYEGSNALGRYCDVSVMSSMTDTTPLSLYIQAKHR